MGVCWVLCYICWKEELEEAEGPSCQLGGGRRGARTQPSKKEKQMKGRGELMGQCRTCWKVSCLTQSQKKSWLASTVYIRERHFKEYLDSWRYLSQQRLMTFPQEHWEYQLLQTLSCKPPLPTIPQRWVMPLGESMRVKTIPGFKRGTKEGSWSFEIRK